VKECLRLSHALPSSGYVLFFSSSFNLCVSQKDKIRFFAFSSLQLSHWKKKKMNNKCGGGADVLSPELKGRRQTVSLD